MVPPDMMCRKHLLGEHIETHMFVGAINKGSSVAGYITGGLLEFDSLRQRHDKLVHEMMTRGYKHNSPLPETIVRIENRKINVENNIRNCAIGARSVENA